MDSDLRTFLASSSLIAASPSSSSSPPPISSFRSSLSLGLHLVARCPSASRDALFQLVAVLADAAADIYLRSNSSSRERREAAETVERAGKRIEEMVQENPKYWAAHTAQWSMSVLGDLSAKYTAKVGGGKSTTSSSSSSSSSSPVLHDALPAWLACPPARVIIELATKSLDAVVAEDADKTERCISVLLDLSVRFSSNFDWVVAHVGGRFPDTVITRVLAVGLKDFCAHAEKTKDKRDKAFNVARVPKINSVVGILSHLASTHRKEIGDSFHAMVTECLDEGEKTQTAQHVGTIPYLLYLASLSGVLSASLTDGIYDRVTLDMADRITDLIDLWEERYFQEDSSLVNLSVQLVLKSAGAAGKDLLRLLLDLGGETNREVAREVRNGCRLVLDLVLADLQIMVHSMQTTRGGEEAASADCVGMPLITSLAANADYFMENYFLVKDSYHRRCAISLLSYLSLHRAAGGGRAVAIRVIKHCLLNAETEEELGIMFEFVKDTELWVPGVVATAVSQTLRAKISPAKQANLLDNLGHALQYQSFPAASTSDADYKLKLVSQFSRCVAERRLELFGKMSHREFVPKVLKILHFVPLQLQGDPESVSLPLLHAAAQCLVHTVFILLEDSGKEADEAGGAGAEDDEDDEESLNLMLSQCIRVLLDVASAHPAGMPMVIRYLVDGAVNSKFAELFGGKFRGAGVNGGLKGKTTNASELRLFEENLKYGSMPTHPLGSTAAFHAGTIGDGKRRPVKFGVYSRYVNFF
jgi:integrator complex subunit 5